MEQLSQVESLLSLSNHCLEAKSAGRGFVKVPLQPHFRSIGILHPAVQKSLDEFLFQPAQEIRNRPSHSFRSHLVDAGFQLAGGRMRSAQDQRNLELCSDSIEFLHLGSLIVDDIQDGSAIRRNGKALHCMLGTGHALGVGNWLYFHSLRMLSRLELGDGELTSLYEIYHEAVELAHYGQIMDLCLKIDRVPFSQIVPLSHECMRYKTGSIVMLALILGATVAGADKDHIKALENLGYALGIYLQRLNDLGNCFGTFDSEKKWEDLISWKPSFIWEFVAKTYGAAAVQELIKAVRELPQSSAWEAWLIEHNLADDAKALAEKDWEEALLEFWQETRVSWSDLRSLCQLKERIQNAYG